VKNQITRVFIISLDGATFDVLRPLISQGYMPNLGRVLQFMKRSASELHVNFGIADLRRESRLSHEKGDNGIHSGDAYVYC
jgi:hypothetical protein